MFWSVVSIDPGRPLVKTGLNKLKPAAGEAMPFENKPNSPRAPVRPGAERRALTRSVYLRTNCCGSMCCEGEGEERYLYRVQGMLGDMKLRGRDRKKKSK